jgi:hypothetical protein
MILVSIGEQSSPQSYCTVIRKKCDITSLLGQMCPPAAMSASFGELGPIVPLSAWQVVCMCDLPGTAVGRACLVMVNSTPCLNRGCGAACGEGSRHQWQGWWLWSKGAFCSLHGFVCQGAKVLAVVVVMLREVGVIHGAVVPIVGVPLQ